MGLSRPHPHSRRSVLSEVGCLCRFLDASLRSPHSVPKLWFQQDRLRPRLLFPPNLLSLAVEVTHPGQQRQRPVESRTAFLPLTYLYSDAVLPSRRLQRMCKEGRRRQRQQGWATSKEL